MAQTRAISRACRSAFAHVVVMIDADLATTPAEEVPDGGFIDVTPEPKAETNSGGMPDAEFNRLNGMMRSADVKESALLKEYGVSDLRLLNKQQYGDALSRLAKAIEARAKAETNAAAQSNDEFGGPIGQRPRREKGGKQGKK